MGEFRLCEAKVVDLDVVVAATDGNGFDTGARTVVWHICFCG